MTLLSNYSKELLSVPFSQEVETVQRTFQLQIHGKINSQSERQDQ